MSHTARQRPARQGTEPPAPWRYPRHPGDLLRLVAGLAVLIASAEMVRRDRVGALETDLFRAANDLSGRLYPLLWAVMQLGNVVAVPVLAGLAVLARRFRLALDLALAGGAAWLAARLVKHLVERGRPPSLLRAVHVRGPAATGLGYVSGHAAVAVALAAAGSPYLGRRARRWVWLAAATVCLSRLYVGAHLPLDVVGGAAVGWLCGALVHLVLGAPGGRPLAERVRRALGRRGVPVTRLEVLAVDARRSARYLATTPDGQELFVKYVPRERRDGDLVWRAWRTVVHGRAERPAPGSPAEQVEREAYMALLADAAGVRVPAVVLATATGNGAGLLVQRWIAPGPPLSAATDGAVLHDLWQQVATMQQAGIAHGDLACASVVIDRDGLAWLVDFDRAQACADDELLAADLAELLLCLADTVGTERALRSARDTLGRAALEPLRTLPLPKGQASRTRDDRRVRNDRWRAIQARLADEAAPPLRQAPRG